MDQHHLNLVLLYLFIQARWGWRTLVVECCIISCLLALVPLLFLAI